MKKKKLFIGTMCFLLLSSFTVCFAGTKSEENTYDGRSIYYNCVCHILSSKAKTEMNEETDKSALNYATVFAYKSNGKLIKSDVAYKSCANSGNYANASVTTTKAAKAKSYHGFTDKNKRLLEPSFYQLKLTVYK